LRGSLYDAVGELAPSALHLAVADHALAGSPDETTLATLNFDALLEAALRDGGTTATTDTGAVQSLREEARGKR
jgi:hypothetical protein